MISSLRIKALLVVFITLLTVLGANTLFLSWGFISYQRNALENKTRMLGEHLREEVGRALNLGVPIESLDGVNGYCSEIVEDNKELGYCMLVNKEGRILYHNDRLRAGGFIRNPAAVRAALSGTGIVRPTTEEGAKYYDVYVPVRDSEHRPLGAIRLGLKYDAIVKQIYPLLWESTIIAVFMFLLASVLVTFFITRKVVTPIVELSRSASLIARGDLSRRLEIESGDEVGRLAQSFNHMAESLGEREDLIQQGYADLEKANDELQSSYKRLEQAAGELSLKSQHLNEKVDELSFLRDATDRLRLGIELDDILASVARDITDGLGYERVLVGLVNEDKGTIEEKVSLGFVGKERELLSEPLEPGGIFSAAVSGRQAQYVAQAALDRRVPARLVEYMNLKEFAVIPMVGKDRTVGALIIDNRRSQKPIRKDKLDIISTFASTAAMAVENAYLYRQLMDNLETVERANYELMSLDQSKTNFLSLASHELRTPLVSVMGYLNLMLAGDLGNISVEQREILEIAIKGATRLRDIIEDLLMVAKIEDGHLPLRLRWIAVEEVVDAALAEVGPFMGQRDVAITRERLRHLPKMEGDFDRIQQCFTNLIGNAVKFTPDGGKISISGRKVKLDKETGVIKPLPSDASILSADTWLELAVEDNGIGIAKEHIEKIFEKFFEVGDVDAHSTGKAKFLGGGTGLGLSITRGIVEAHGGKIWAQSEGEDALKCPGSRFVMLLPVKQPRVKTGLPELRAEGELVKGGAAGAAGPARDASRRLKILLVEDDEDAVVFTRLILEKRFNVTVASDGFDGLRKAFLEKPDAILLDVWMPGLNGFEVCRVLKENRQTADIPIAMFTAAAQKHEMEQGFKCGADDYITKPFTPSELTLRVEKLINSSYGVA